MADLDFISANDKPALLVISSPELLATCTSVLHELDYKVHHAADHDDFLSRFAQVQYQVVVFEETFGGSSYIENFALQRLQNMPMSLRRHTTAFLIGDSFQTLHAMQAYNMSVHAVINPAELGNLKQILQQVVADTSLFLNTYRDTLARIAQGKL